MFLRNFFTYSLILLSTTSFSSDINIVFNSPINKTGPSDLCTTEICKSLTQLINSSKESIDFAIYGLRGQDEILNALINAKNRGIKIRGVIDKDISDDNYYSDTHLIEEYFQNTKSDYQQDIKTSRYFSKNKKYKDRCIRPLGHKGPLQCFEGKGYVAKMTFLSKVI
jgi:phosphatidylserine/phosphatidylglycerophosphate/cardiolipin synthase-like enzyme